jgi:hypothetical protein
VVVVVVALPPGTSVADAVDVFVEWSAGCGATGVAAVGTVMLTPPPKAIAKELARRGAMMGVGRPLVGETIIPSPITGAGWIGLGRNTQLPDADVVVKF